MPKAKKDDSSSDGEGSSSDEPSSHSLEGEPPEGTPTVDWYRRWKADPKVGRAAEQKREAAFVGVEPADVALSRAARQDRVPPPCRGSPR